MSIARPAPLTMLAIALTLMAVAAALFILYAHPAHAEEGSAPDKPIGLTGTATHDAITLTWDDPNDDSITGYVVLRRDRDTDAKGHFDELVADTDTAATTYTDDSVAAETRYTYRIKAINEHGTSERSRWYHIDTQAPPEPAANSPATGAPTITGTVQMGETLTANNSGIADADGLSNVQYEYQWLADDAEIAGATNSTYTLADTDEGIAIKVEVTFTDDAGNGETLTSAATDAVAAAEPTEPPDKPTGLEATVSPGQVVLAWNDPDDESITGYVILRRVRENDQGGDFSVLVANTESAATTYTDNEVAASTTYTYRIKAINEHGTSERSRWYHIDTPAAPEPPANNPATGAPAITGTAQVGETLTVDASGIGDEDGLENAAFRHQWLADGTAISGATANAYTPVGADEGNAITVQVNFTDDAGNDETLTSAPTDAVAAAEPKEPPAQPTGLIATATHDQVLLTWEDPQDDSITGYVILRRVRVNDTGGEFSVLAPDTGTAATTYTDDTVEASTTYTYRIKAVNGAGTSERSRWSHIDTTAAPQPEADPELLAPSGLTAVLTDGQVVLSWDAPAEDAAAVTGYEILRAEGEGELAVLVADTGNTATAYTDDTVAAAGAGYAYRIKAVRDGERSGASGEARVRLKPARPTGLTAETVAHDTVTLTWNDPQDDSVTGYAVVRWKLGFNSSGIVTIAADTGTADPGYTDETVEPETEYIYNIKAINAQGESEQSEPLRVKTPAAPDPALFAPSNLTVELVDERVSLGWDAPAEDAGLVTGYEILSTRGWDAPVILVADTASAATAYTDETADAPGESYAYTVKAIRDRERSQASGEAVIQLPGPPPSAPAGLIASFGAGGIFLNWQAPVEDAATVTGYEVLRAQGEGELTILVADTGNAATAYTDATAGGASERYAYRVRAIRGGERSADSNEARVQLPPAAPRRVLSAAASDLVLLSWADPGDDSVTGYRILRRRAVADVADDFVTLAEDTGSAETSYADDTVENGRVYVYRVLAIGPGGVSEPSRDVRVRTTEPVPPPNQPRGLPSQGTPQPRQSVSEPSGDDFPQDGTTTGRLEVGGSVTGNIDSNGDADAFAIELVPGRTYRFDLEGSETEQGTLADPVIVHIFLVLGPGDSSLLVGSTDLDSGKGENSQLEFTLPSRTTYPTGTYYIVVAEHGDNATGTYRLSMDQVAGSGYGRTMTVKGNLQPGSPLSGTLDVPTAGIFSYYFALEDLEVGRYTVDFGTGGIHSIHHFLTDRNRTGHVTLDDTWVIVAQGHGRRSFTFDVRPGMEGTHYVLLNILKDDIGDYTATLEKAMPHLRVGRTGLVGEVPADSDGFALHMEFFSVDLEAGQGYQVDIEGKHSRDEECEDDGGNDEACTLDHTMLGNIQAPDGKYVGGDGNFDNSDDDVGGSVLHFYGGGDRGNTRFTFTAEQDGTHFLKVGGRLMKIKDGDVVSSGFRAGTFRLSVREVN